jgi:ketosteroid isomerase-like protein
LPSRPLIAPGVEAFVELWEELRFDAEEYCEMDDDSVLVVCRMRGRGRGSGVEVDQRRASLFHIRAGKVIRLGSTGSATAPSPNQA